MSGIDSSNLSGSSIIPSAFFPIHIYEQAQARLKRKKPDSTESPSLFENLVMLMETSETNQIQRYIQLNGDINIQGDDGRSLLSHALLGDGSFEMIDFLLNQSQLKINAIEKNGKTPLFSAIERKNPHKKLEIIAKMIAKNADCSIQNERGNTPLMLAVKTNLKIFTLIFEQLGEEHLFVKNKKNDSALSIAIHNGHKKMALLLLAKLDQAHASLLNECDGRGDFLLQQAAKNLDDDLVKELLNCYQKFHLKPTAACYEKTLGELVLSEKASDKEKESLLKIVQALMQSGININEEMSGGLTPLIQAVSKRQWELALILLDNKANANCTDRKGWTALSHLVHAIRNSTEESLEQEEGAIKALFRKLFQRMSLESIKNTAHQTQLPLREWNPRIISSINLLTIKRNQTPQPVQSAAPSQYPSTTDAARRMKIRTRDPVLSRTGWQADSYGKFFFKTTLLTHYADTDWLCPQEKEGYIDRLKQSNTIVSTQEWIQAKEARLAALINSQPSLLGQLCSLLDNTDTSTRLATEHLKALKDADWVSRSCRGFLENIFQSTWKEPTTQLTLSEVLSLVWSEIQNSHYLTSEERHTLKTKLGLTILELFHYKGGSERVPPPVVFDTLVHVIANSGLIWGIYVFSNELEKQALKEKIKSQLCSEQKLILFYSVGENEQFKLFEPSELMLLHKELDSAKRKADTLELNEAPASMTVFFDTQTQGAAVSAASAHDCERPANKYSRTA